MSATQWAGVQIAARPATKPQRVRPVDVDGTPLHVGDLVEWVFAAERWHGTRLVVTSTRTRGVVHARAVDSATGSSWSYKPRHLRLVPETRHERIVRRSHERPQVVQVVYGPRARFFRSWAVIDGGRCIPVSRRIDALWIACRPETIRSAQTATRHTWAVL